MWVVRAPTAVLCLLVPLAAPFVAPRRGGASLWRSTLSLALGPDDSISEEPTPEDEALANELEDMALAQELAEKSKELARGGPNRVSAQYFNVLTNQHPSELVRDFYATATPSARAAVQEAIFGLLGSAREIDAEFTTTGARIADLCLRLQISGYMLRNAEYVLALQKLLRLRTSGRAAQADLRAAFDRLDRDRSGYIEVDEVEALFTDLYEEEEMEEQPQGGRVDTDTFVRFFDRNLDGRISFAEFSQALGGADADAAAAPSSTGPAASPRFSLTEAAAPEEDKEETEAPKLAEPRVSGSVRVDLGTGSWRTVDAADYVDDLRAEAARLRAALAVSAKPQEQLASISEYLASISQDQRDLLTTSMSGDAKKAAQDLVSYVLSGGAASTTGHQQHLEPSSEVMLEKRVLEQICRWQLILGYRLRELEARDDAQRRLGA